MIGKQVWHNKRIFLHKWKKLSDTYTQKIRKCALYMTYIKNIFGIFWCVGHKTCQFSRLRYTLSEITPAVMNNAVNFMLKKVG